MLHFVGVLLDAFLEVNFLKLTYNHTFFSTAFCAHTIWASVTPTGFTVMYGPILYFPYCGSIKPFCHNMANLCTYTVLSRFMYF